MEILFEDNMLKAGIEEEKSLFYFEWTKESELLQNETLLNYSKNLLEFVLKGKYKLVLENAINFKYLIDNELQEVIAAEVVSNLNGVVDKIAHVHPKDFIIDVSVELVWDETPFHTKKFEEEYFHTLEDAYKWLN